MEKLLRACVKFWGRVYFAVCKPGGRRKDYIAPSGKVLGPEELSYMLDASLDMWLTTGRFNDEFEQKFAEYMGVKHALTTNSGSSANLLALSALTSHKLGDKRLKHGDEVITVAAGFPTTVNPIIQNGLIPVFADVKIGTYNIDEKQLEECLSSKTKAVFMAHTLGNTFDIDTVKAFCEKHSLWLIEDNCDALGSTYNGKLTGTFGHIGTFSFYPAHHITMGEGGAVITNDTALYRIIMSFRDWGRDCWCPPGKDNTCKNRFNMKLGNLPFGYDHKYTYSHIGYNLKITDWQAACGLAQLKKLDSYIEKRRENFRKIVEGLRQFEKYIILPVAEEKSVPSWFGLLLSTQEGIDKIDLCKYLEDHGVGTRQLFAGNMLRQPEFVDNEIAMRIRNSGMLNSKNLNEEHYAMLPETDREMNTTFWIGVWPGITDADIAKVITTFRDYFNQPKKA